MFTADNKLKNFVNLTVCTVSNNSLDKDSVQYYQQS